MINKIIYEIGYPKEKYLVLGASQDIRGETKYRAYAISTEARKYIKKYVNKNKKYFSFYSHENWYNEI